MATVTVITPGTAVTTNASSYAGSSFTPVANDLLVVLATLSGHAAYDTPSLTSSVGGQTFTLIDRAVFSGSAHTTSAFVADTLSTAVAQSYTYQCSADPATGCILFGVRIAGMNRTGIDAIRQSAKLENQAAGTPAPSFGSAALTSNVCIGVVGNNTNPAALTPPSGWTEPGAPSGDTGYATPATGSEFAYINSGFTGTTVTWGSSSASGFAAIIIELDTSAAGAVEIPQLVTARQAM